MTTHPDSTRHQPNSKPPGSFARLGPRLSMIPTNTDLRQREDRRQQVHSLAPRTLILPCGTKVSFLFTTWRAMAYESVRKGTFYVFADAAIDTVLDADPSKPCTAPYRTADTPKGLMEAVSHAQAHAQAARVTVAPL